MRDSPESPRNIALVLAGAVAKGAFEAGALEIIASRNLAVRRVVAVSSGALNGTAFAAGVRARREEAAARELTDVWRHEADLRGALHPSLRAILRRQGISDQARLLDLLRRHVKPSEIPNPAPIELHLIVAPLHGMQGSIDGEPATTYSHVVGFTGESFDDAKALEEVFVAATASAALPILYAPVDLPGLGPCIDGGLVNNNPLDAAIGPCGGATLDAVIVIAPTPALLQRPPKDQRGLDLLAHEVDMVFAEWLYQDLRRCVQQSEGLTRLDALAARHGFTPTQVDEIRRALRIELVRPLPFISIRPMTRLPGTLFSGFTDARLRAEYIDLGRERATTVLDALGWR
ncbi:Patatin [Minicystis rosea]|nr:Patatin [Minicystis rosea]